MIKVIFSCAKHIETRINSFYMSIECLLITVMCVSIFLYCVNKLSINVNNDSEDKKGGVEKYVVLPMIILISKYKYHRS